MKAADSNPRLEREFGSDSRPRAPPPPILSEPIDRCTTPIVRIMPIRLLSPTAKRGCVVTEWDPVRPSLARIDDGRLRGPDERRRGHGAGHSGPFRVSSAQAARRYVVVGVVLRLTERVPPIQRIAATGRGRAEPPRDQAACFYPCTFEEPNSYLLRRHRGERRRTDSTSAGCSLNADKHDPRAAGRVVTEATVLIMASARPGSQPDAAARASSAIRSWQVVGRPIAGARARCRLRGTAFRETAALLAGNGASAQPLPVRVVRFQPRKPTRGLDDEEAAVVEATTSLHREQYEHSRQARSYLRKRGIDGAKACDLRIGYADGGLARHLRERRLDFDAAQRLGLLTGDRVPPGYEAKGRTSRSSTSIGSPSSRRRMSSAVLRDGATPNRARNSRNRSTK